MGNNTTESFPDYLKTLKILKCPNCKDSYDLDKKVPKMICNNQHNLCDQCLKQLKSKICLECKEVMWSNKKKNAILTYILEQMMSSKQNKSDISNEKEQKEQQIEEFQEIRSTRLAESPSKRVIKLKMVKQQSNPNINLENYNEDKQFKKKYSVASIFGVLRQEMQIQSKAKAKQQSFEDVLNKHAWQYSIVAFKQIIQKKKNPEEIVNLDLHLNKIPKIFQVFSKFSNIQRLNLSKNRIKKIENIQTLRSLTYLSISQNQIEIIENVGQLINLKNLYLNKNRIQRIQALQALSHLEFLGLGGNLLEKIEGIGHLLELKWLNLEGNYIQKVEGINSLKNLEIILLGNNQITIFQGFDQLQNLKEIHVQTNKITDLGKALSMKHLRKLKLQDNPGLKEDHSKDYLKLLQLIEAKSKGIQKPDDGCSIY